MMNSQQLQDGINLLEKVARKTIPLWEWMGGKRPDDLQWACIGHNPTAWGFGIKKGSMLHNIIATIERQKDGSWWWEARFEYGPGGKEPSRDYAIEAVMKRLKEILDN